MRVSLLLLSRVRVNVFPYRSLTFKRPDSRATVAPSPALKAYTVPFFRVRFQRIDVGSQVIRDLKNTEGVFSKQGRTGQACDLAIRVYCTVFLPSETASIDRCEILERGFLLTMFDERLSDGYMRRREEVNNASQTPPVDVGFFTFFHGPLVVRNPGTSRGKTRWCHCMECHECVYPGPDCECNDYDNGSTQHHLYTITNARVKANAAS